MNSRALVGFGIAAVAMLSVTGCFSQQHSSVQGGQGEAGSSGAAHMSNASWTPNSVSWSSGKTAQFKDPALGETAYTVNVPAGWRAVGVILRPPGCYKPSVPADGLSFTLLGPDGYTAVGQLPGASWTWNSDGSGTPGTKCAPIGITSAAGFLINIAVPNMQPDATSVTLVPNTPQMQHNLDALRQQIGQSAMPGLQSRRMIDSGRVRIEYKLGEQPMEEMLFAILDCQEINMPAYPMLHRAAVTRRNCSVHATVFRRAPKGQLDALLATNPPAPRIDQEWDQRIQQRMQAAFAEYQRASNAQFQAIQKHFADVTSAMLQRGRDFQDSQQRSFEHAMAADRANQQAIDHAAHLQVLDSLNRQDFIDPSTGRKIETSNQYAHSWISSDKSEVVLNDDPTFDPNGAVDPVRESWTELIPVD